MAVVIYDKQKWLSSSGNVLVLVFRKQMCFDSNEQNHLWFAGIDARDRGLPLGNNQI